MVHMRGLLERLLPASPDISVPPLFMAQTRSLSCLAVKVHWSAAATTLLTGVTAAFGPVVPDKVWWGVVAAVIADGSVISYQRFRRR
ncbi:hypothetical protein [Streptomyces sp. NBC_00986]|uniref:hypothetical protein n=1 Tax=Streptomyces sp. NBC_00986 TaxID=2903702 RepID=UPI0038699487|nr:hypothetical protein OG504_01730 [Streptomyces sp. NBC_00986]